jgi:hypothetical protein
MNESLIERHKMMGMYIAPQDLLSQALNITALISRRFGTLGIKHPSQSHWYDVNRELLFWKQPEVRSDILPSFPPAEVEI